ncbi:MAG: SufD family Fe-S cluster assembly protein [Syntrophomonadaceae bacterium]|nr:SufD family Fe-S cluster assembly protein [Syntrophomonadaceae bacterium]
MTLNAIDKQLLEAVAELHEVPIGAYNIRKDGQAVARNSTANIVIIPKTDQEKPGIDILVKPGTKNESVHIPVILSRTGLHDLVYNTFDIGEDADVVVIAGCGIHNAGCETTQHDGIHEIRVRRGARLRYIEKHYGEGLGEGARILNPQTILTVDEGASAELELIQIKGVDYTRRYTEVKVHEGGNLRMVEKLLTHGTQEAKSFMDIYLIGKNANAQVIARSVGQDCSVQNFRAVLIGQAPCRGHVECDSIIMDQARIEASPQLRAENTEAELTHEAAIGKIAGDQLIKLMSLGLTEKEAIDTILNGFLR